MNNISKFKNKKMRFKEIVFFSLATNLFTYLYLIYIIKDFFLVFFGIHDDKTKQHIGLNIRYSSS